MALYWLIGGPRDGEGRVAHDRGPTDERVVHRSESWLYGRGYYVPAQPIRYVKTPEGAALVLTYTGNEAPAHDGLT